MSPIHTLAMLAAISTAAIPQAVTQTPPATAATGASHSPLNVLLIVSDDQQATAMGCAGNPIIKTPNLDRLAGSGVRFTHAFVTVPICTPSRATFLTGKTEAFNGVPFFGMPILPNTPTWSGTLADRGYQAAITGKWHNSPLFDRCGFSWSANMCVGGMWGDYVNPMLSQRADDKPKVIKGHITELITDAAIRFLNERDMSKPFFLYVAYSAPHDPRQMPPGYERMYDAEKIPLPPNFKPAPIPDPGTLMIRDEKLLPRPLDPAAIRRETANYYGLITHMDHQIGRILDNLDRLGLTENTIIFFASDNGLTLGAHGLLGKQTLHEEGVRVPLIIRHPKLTRKNGVCDALVYLLDMFPTACDWTGTAIPEGVQGKSLSDLYEGKSQRVRDVVFGRYDENSDPLFRSIRGERYKLIQYLKYGREQLFDLTRDPYELTDLADDPTLQATRQQLRDQLTAWRAEQDRMEATWRKPTSQPH